MRSLHVALLIVALTISVLSPGCDSNKNRPIKIAVVGPYSGGLKSLGLPPKNAVMLAVNRLNKAGGLLGREVHLIAEDDQCDPKRAVEIATALVKEGVIAVVGHVCSGATIAAMNIYRGKKILIISPSATNPALTQSGKNPFFFRTIPHDAAQAISQSRFILGYLKARRIAIAHDGGDYGKGLATLIKGRLEEAGSRIVLFEKIDPGREDYSALVERISEANPDVVVFGGYSPEGSKLILQARKKGVKAHFISGDELKTKAFIQEGGKWVEGCFVSSPADISKIPAAIVVTRELMKRDQKAGLFGLQAHAAVTAIFNSIEKSGSTSPDKMKIILQTDSVATTLGSISFNRRGDIVGSGFAIYQVVNGDFVPVDW